MHTIIHTLNLAETTFPASMTLSRSSSPDKSKDDTDRLVLAASSGMLRLTTLVHWLYGHTQRKITVPKKLKL